MSLSSGALKKKICVHCHGYEVTDITGEDIRQLKR